MPAWMSDLLSNNGFVFWGAITLICVVPSLCHYWYKARRHELDVQLKHALAERGMSADEIVRVLEAGRGGGRDDDGGFELKMESDAVRAARTPLQDVSR